MPAKIAKILIAWALWIAAPLVCCAQVNTDQVMRIGRNAMYFDDYMVAIQYFNQVIQAKPYLPQPYFYRAVAKLSLDDYAGAEADASAAIERNPYITDAYEVRAVARQNLGRYAEAIPDYQRVLLDKPDSRSVLTNMSLAQMDTGDAEGARATLGTLIERFPRFDGGYVARARFLLEQGDTIAALADASRAIELNANATNAYLIRADIMLATDSVGTATSPQLASALADMEMAVKLQPTSAGMYINRAFLRYRSDDYIGAMADYDHALQLDPLNTVALFNRALLRGEVRDFNNAIADLTQVLSLNPTQYRALFNRATLYHQIGDLDNAYTDICRVIEAFPQFAAALYLRSAIEYDRGNHRAAERDYNKSLALAREELVLLPDSDIGSDGTHPDTESTDADADAATHASAQSQEAVKARFTSLLRIEDMGAHPGEYSAGSTRGHIQNTDFAIHLEPPYTLSYYVEPSELKSTTDFMRDLDRLNASSTLPNQLYLTIHEPQLTDEQFTRHRASATYYDSRLSTHTPRAVDYLARALDYAAMRHYPNALADLDRAIALSPEFTVALLLRSTLRYRQAQADAESDAPSGRDAAIARQGAVNAALADIDEVIRLAPDMAVAWYNRGAILAAESDFREALTALSHAVILQPEMGEAWYNRGYVNMMLGRKDDAFADLSRAGELGIAPSYSLIKRMSSR